MYMSKYVLLFILALGFIQCKNNPAGDPALSALEKEFNSNPSEDNYNKLVGKYLEIIQSSNKGKDISGLLVNAFQAANKMKKNDHEILFINNLVKSYPDRPDNKTNIIRMIELLNASGKSTTANLMSYAFIKAFPEDPKSNEFKTNLPKMASAEAYILEIGQSIFADTIKGFDEMKAREYVDACEAFAMVLPNDPQAAEYLFKAAETSSTLKTFEKSFALYDWIIDKYPHSERAPVALFMKGFIFDGTIKDSANAAKYYTEFIQKYPESPFYKDAKVLLSNLGKSDEQVLEELRKKSEGSN